MSMKTFPNELFELVLKDVWEIEDEAFEFAVHAMMRVYMETAKLCHTDHSSFILLVCKELS